MALGSFLCSECGNQFQRENGEANRTLRKVGYLFCSRTCSGIHRRSLKTDEQKKIEKAEYDRQYRLKNLESLKIKKAEYFQRTYDPVTAKAKRKQECIGMLSIAGHQNIGPTSRNMTRYTEPRNSMASSMSQLCFLMNWKQK